MKMNKLHKSNACQPKPYLPGGGCSEGWLNVKDNNKGFNLVELLVSIAIFGMIAGAAMVNLRGSSPTREIQFQADNIASLLRQAQVMSLAGEPHNSVVPSGGYGVSFALCAAPPCSVTLFADLNNNFILDPGAEEVNNVVLGTNVTITAISTGDPTNVVFKPPRPFICFNTTCSGVGEFTATLGSSQVTKTIDVTVNQVSGQISS